MGVHLLIGGDDFFLNHIVENKTYNILRQNWEGKKDQEDGHRHKRSGNQHEDNCNCK